LHRGPRPWTGDDIIGSAGRSAPAFLELEELEPGTHLIALRSARTDLQGRYRFSGLPPGRYRLLSSFDFERPSAQDMEAARADEVSLKESSDITTCSCSSRRRIAS